MLCQTPTDAKSMGSSFCRKPPESIKQRSLLKRFVRPQGRGGGNSYTLSIGACAARRGQDFGAPDLERAIQFYDGAPVSDPVAH